jgi:hypothetical protein
MKPYKSIYEKLVLPIEKDDEILIGKFKNKTAIVTGFDTDDKNQPIILVNGKEKPMLNFKIKKLLPKNTN